MLMYCTVLYMYIIISLWIYNKRFSYYNPMYVSFVFHRVMYSLKNI